MNKRTARFTVIPAMAIALLQAVSGCSDDRATAPAGSSATVSGEIHSASPYECETDALAQGESGAALSPAAAPARVTVKAYTHRLKNGANDWTAAEVEATKALIEAQLAPGNIYVLWVGGDAPDDPGQSGGAYDVFWLMNTYGDAGYVDIFFGSKDGTQPDGWANGIGESPYACVVWGPATGTSVPTHEVGHVLGLPHTHGGKDTGICPLTVFDGDAPPVFDTPPDPGLGHGTRVAPGCVYDPPDADTCPILLQFHPDCENIMSYTRLECLNRFSDGQYRVMRSTVSTSGLGVNAEVTTNVPAGGLVPCPAGDGDVLTISVDLDLESVAAALGVVSADRITVAPPDAGTGVTFFGSGVFGADHDATPANGYTTTITIAEIGGCGTAELEVQLDGHYLASATITVKSYDNTADGVVNLSEVGLISAANNKCSGDPGYDDCFDFVEDDCVDTADIGALAAHLGHSAAASAAPSAARPAIRELAGILDGARH